MAPVSPAKISARIVPGVRYSGSHLLKGNCQRITTKFALRSNQRLSLQALPQASWYCPKVRLASPNNQQL